MTLRIPLFLSCALLCRAAAPSVNVASLPLAFEPGPDGSEFRARAAGLNVAVRADGATIHVGKDARKRPIRMRLVDANARAAASPLDRLPGTVAYFLGSDPSKWRTGIATYGKLEYRAVYPGVDVIYYGNGRELEYDFRLAAGSDPGRIRLQFEGGSRPAVLGSGELAVGDLRQPRPVAYQTVNGVRATVDCRYVVRADGQVGVALGAYDRSQPLTIDPVLRYASYLGGTVNEAVTSLKVDAAGNIYMTGFTSSNNFPTSGAQQASYAGNNSSLQQLQFGDAFVAKLNPAGTALIYATYVGGSGDDFATSIAIDAAGAAYVTGNTQSTNFPTTAGAPQRTNRGFGSGDNGFYNPSDAFAFKLNTAGSQLLYATYLGGSLNDMAIGIAVDGTGNAIVVGGTISSDFTTTSNAYQAQYRGANNVAPNFGPSIAGDGFLTILNASGTALAYSTYLGGSGRDGIAAVAVDQQNNIYVTGATLSSNFPVTTGAPQGTFRGTPQQSGQATIVPADAFVAKFNPQGQPVYSTFLGGTRMDAGMAIAVDKDGAAYVAGGTLSTDFPVTAGAAQSTFRGTGAVGTIGASYGGDAFVAKVNAAGTQFAYSTYLGGTGDEAALGIGVDGNGYAVVAGFTISTNFPVTPDALQGTNAGFGGQALAPYPMFGFENERVRNTGDGFVTRLTPAGGLSYSSFYGGSRDDIAMAVAVDSNGHAYIGGNTLSTALPGASTGVQPAYGGGGQQFPRGDGFVAKIELDRIVVTPTPARVNVVAGFNGTGTVSAALATPFTVEVVDASGAPVANVTVTFAATNATVSPATATTNAQGRASANVTLGSTAGAGSVTATVAGIPAASAALTINAAVSGPVVRAVVNGASYLSAISPGSWISVYLDVTAPELVQASGTLPTTLGGIRVLAGGRAMPLLAIIPLSPSGTQINAQLPYETAAGPAQITVERNGVASAAFAATVQASAPGIFIFGDNRAVAQNIAPNGTVSVNTADNPIPAGDYIILYLTGQGPLDNPVATGGAASGSPLSIPTLPFSAMLGSTEIPIAFLGMTPGNIALAQANIQIPRNTPPGTYTLSVKIGQATSNAPSITVSAPRP